MLDHFPLHTRNYDWGVFEHVSNPKPKCSCHLRELVISHWENGRTLVEAVSVHKWYDEEGQWHSTKAQMGFKWVAKLSTKSKQTFCSTIIIQWLWARWEPGLEWPPKQPQTLDIMGAIEDMGEMLAGRYEILLDNHIKIRGVAGTDHHSCIVIFALITDAFGF